MKQTGIWIDTAKAIVVDLENGKEKVTEIESNVETRALEGAGDSGSFMGDQHLSREQKINERKKHQLNDYLDDVMNHLKSSDKVFVFGPAEVKNKLADAIKENTLLSKVHLIGVETADSMTDNQVVAKVKEAFKN